MDTRIFYRYCLTLQKYYDVCLIACHPAHENVKGIEIYPYPRYKNRLFRVAFSWFLLLPKALKCNAKIYHLHDPELIPLGLVLRILGKKIIYDIHENIAEDIFDKDWIKFKKLWYSIYSLFERPALHLFHVILAEDSYMTRYEDKVDHLAVIHNYCDLPFFEEFKLSTSQRNPYQLYYIGILLENRGILEILEAMYLAKLQGHYFHLHCVAELYTQVSEAITNLSFYDDIKKQVTFYGRKNLEDGYQISKKAGIGLCIIHPMSNSIGSYPTKLFEYMAVGLPIVTSHFPLYKTVVEDNNCGFTVDPNSPHEIMESIIKIAVDLPLRKGMEKSGLNAVKEKYSWHQEEEKMLNFYRQVLE